MRSRSRWKSVRIGQGTIGFSRPRVSFAQAARGDRRCASSCSNRSLMVIVVSLLSLHYNYNIEGQKSLRNHKFDAKNSHFTNLRFYAMILDCINKFATGGKLTP